VSIFDMKKGPPAGSLVDHTKRWEVVVTIKGECHGPPTQAIVEGWALQQISASASFVSMGPMELQVAVREKLSIPGVPQ